MPKDEKAKRGAPPKSDIERVLPNGWLPEQWERIQQEADIRGISAAAMQRQIGDWFFTALDTKRADVTTSALFDEQQSSEK